MSKNNKMSKEDRIFVGLISSLFDKDEIKELAKKLKKDSKKMDTEKTKETLNKVMDEVNKAKEVKSYLCLINLGEETLSSCSGYFNDIISSIRTVCFNIKRDEREKEKRMLWRNIAETIFEILGEND